MNLINVMTRMKREFVIPAKAGIQNLKQWIPHQVRNDSYTTIREQNTY